jgi:transposase
LRGGFGLAGYFWVPWIRRRLTRKVSLAGFVVWYGAMEMTAESLAAMFGEIVPHLDERQRRLVMGALARALGHGGNRFVAGAAGVREATVSLGAGELASGAEVLGRARRPGGGARRARDKDPGLVPALLALVEPEERGDPGSPLRWTTKSTRALAAVLTRQGHRVGADTVGDLLREEGFSLQGNAKTIEGKQHPDRDAQFRYIAAQAAGHIDAGQPVISVDSKKREKVGLFARPGREWRPRGDPVKVRDHDFPDQELGVVIPYGIYDLAANTGWVNVGTDHDTAAFAVESVRRWWSGPGTDAYPRARRLLITADAGGSNGYRTRAWQAGLAALAAETGLEITCCHFPPGTSKWNKVEHRLFSQITMNWRGRPLTSHAVVLNSIAATTTAAGLAVTAQLDDNCYPTRVKVSDQQMTELEDQALTRHGFHGAWNYTACPPVQGPAPAPPAPAPPGRLAQLTAALASPALTGMSRRDLAALAAALHTPFRAAREQRLYAGRGGPRRNAGWAAGPYRGKLDLTAHLAITLLHRRHSLPCRQIAALLGLDPTTVTDAIRLAGGLLDARGNITEPAPTRLRTLADLRQHAQAVGIDLPAKIKPAD